LDGGLAPILRDDGCDNACMPDESQITVPPSFVALFLSPGRSKPNAPREHIAARHEFCEDLAQLLTEQAGNKRWELSVTEADVLERVHRGLLLPPVVVSAGEAQWVIRRLAEILGWPDPGPAAAAA
jgi:hypothetical protein